MSSWVAASLPPDSSSNDDAAAEATRAEVLSAAADLHVLPLDAHNARMLAHVHPRPHANPTPQPLYNLVVVGAGAGGLVSAAQAARRGARVALVEARLMGGDCLVSGCVPSKALLACAKHAKLARDSVTSGFGVRVRGGDAAVEVNWLWVAVVGMGECVAEEVRMRGTTLRPKKTGGGGEGRWAAVFRRHQLLDQLSPCGRLSRFSPLARSLCLSRHLPLSPSLPPPPFRPATTRHVRRLRPCRPRSCAHSCIPRRPR